MTPESMSIKNRIFVSLIVLSAFSILISSHGCGEKERLARLSSPTPVFASTP